MVIRRKKAGPSGEIDEITTKIIRKWKSQIPRFDKVAAIIK